MFSATLIALISAASAAVWAYSKAMRRTGNNSKNAVTVGGLAGLFVFIVVFTIIKIVDSSLEG